MNEALIDKSTVMELLTYLIADRNVPIDEGTPVWEVLEDIKVNPPNQQYVDLINKAMDEDKSIGDMRVMKTSVEAGYGSPMSAVCFKDDNAVYIQYRGTPKGGWVQNPISFGVDLEGAMAADGISSQIQADGLAFFDDCVKAYAGHGYTGELVVGGHSQGGNVAEYVLMMSEYSGLVDLCLSLDGPNHSKALYNHILERYGTEHFDIAKEKILSINGHNDYVNMLGEMDFATKDNTYYVESKGKDGFVGWHDMGYMINPDNGKLYPRIDNNGKRIKQGPVALMVVEMVAAINKLPAEVREDVAKSVMGLLEMTMGSKDWEDLKNAGLDADNFIELMLSDEVMGTLFKGLPVIGFALLGNPKLLAEFITELIPEDLKAMWDYFINDVPLGIQIGLVAVFAIATAAAVFIVAGIAGIIAPVLGFVMKAVIKKLLTQLVSNALDAVVDFFNAVIEGLQNIANSIKDALNHGDEYVKTHMVIKADTLALRGYADRIGNVQRKLRELDSSMNSLYKEVRLIDQLTALKVNIMTSASLNLGRVQDYLNATAARLEEAESKAQIIMGG